MSPFFVPGKNVPKLYTVTVSIHVSTDTLFKLSLSSFFVTFPGFVTCKCSQTTTLYGDRIIRVPTSINHS